MTLIRKMFIGAALGSVALAFAPVADAGETGAAEPVNYAPPFEPPTRPAFLPLPPGAVEPAGWLREWCLAARDGFTGHMDEYDAEFRRAWAPDHRMTGEGLLWYKGAWPYEGGGYWFDGLARLGHALHDEMLIAQAKRRLYAVADRMNANGLLFLWWLDRNNPDDRKAVTAALQGWPLWACGLLGRAMTGFYAGSGDPHILNALEMAYAGDPDCLRWIPGNMSNPWPAFDTYSWTGNQRIAAALDAMFKHDDGGLLPNLSRYRKAPALKPGTIVTNAHVVEFIESTTPWAVGYLWTGDTRYLQAATGWHDLLERVAMQPHGVPVSDEWYGPPGAFRGSETCDVAGYVWSQICLLLVTGEGRMADRIERAFFNAGPATVSRDFKSHVYFQSPNRFANRSPDFPHGPRAGGGVYQPKHSPLCCTAALNRIVPWYVTHMWMATYDNGLAATCYGPCKVTALAADHVPVVFVCQTDYPFNETIEISVQPAREATFPLDFHIPGWCTAPTLSVNGSAVVVERNTRGFARVHRSWQPDDTVRLHLPMTATVQTGRDAAQGAPYDGAHRATPVAIPEDSSTRGVPYASVFYGPLLFALPIPDTTNANTPDPSARWQFALDVQNPGLTVERTAMPARWDWPLTAPLKLRANVVELSWNPDPKAPRLPPLPAIRSKPAEPVTLIPYGCTTFRISMFPVTAEPEVKPAAIRRILFLGNSITLHGPKADIGWTGNWGMAASAEDKDYVHIVTRAIARHTGSTPRIMVRNIADFERNYAAYDVDGHLKDQFAFDPDLVVLAIGENVPAVNSETSRAQFKAAVSNILRCALAKRRPLVVVRSSFWADPAKDHVLSQACQEAGGIFVNAGPLGREAVNAARTERSFTHAGVAGHPGDKGMKALADAIVRAVLQRTAPTETRVAPVEKPAAVVESTPVRKNVKLPGLVVNFQKKCVDIEATICLEEGYLELIACLKGSKDHESIVAINARPMHIHAALLLLGAIPGNPAMQKPIDEQQQRWIHVPPTGSPVDVYLVFANPDGTMIEHPISNFVAPSDEGPDGTSDSDQDSTFPHTFLFAGSLLRGNGPGPRQYLSDLSGNVISIATFGDELLCLPGVHGHDNGSLMWQVNPTELPTVGSKVTLRLRPQVQPAPKADTADPGGTSSEVIEKKENHE